MTGEPATPRWVAEELGLTGTGEHAEAATDTPDPHPDDRLRCACGHAEATHLHRRPWPCSLPACPCSAFVWARIADGHRPPDEP